MKKRKEKIKIFFRNYKWLSGSFLALILGYIFGIFSSRSSYELLVMWFERFDMVENIFFLFIFFVSVRTVLSFLKKDKTK